MSSLIEAVHIRGGTIKRQTTAHGFSLLELALPIPGMLQARIQITRPYVGETFSDEVVLDALSEAQMILNTIHDKLSFV